MGESDERVHPQRSPGDARTESLEPATSLQSEAGAAQRVGKHKWESVACGRTQMGECDMWGTHVTCGEHKWESVTFVGNTNGM